VKAWQRIVLRLFMFIDQMVKNTVLDSWMQERTVPAPVTPPSLLSGGQRSKKDSHKATAAGKLRTQEKPMNGSFPNDRTTCSHKKELLVAGGGRGPSYWWHCKGCGSRWERVTEQEAQAIFIGDPEDPNSSSLRPATATPIRPSGQIPSSKVENLQVVEPKTAQPAGCPASIREAVLNGVKDKMLPVERMPIEIVKQLVAQPERLLCTARVEGYKPSQKDKEETEALQREMRAAGIDWHQLLKVMELPEEAIPADWKAPFEAPAHANPVLIPSSASSSAPASTSQASRVEMETDQELAHSKVTGRRRLASPNSAHV